MVKKLSWDDLIPIDFICTVRFIILNIIITKKTRLTSS